MANSVPMTIQQTIRALHQRGYSKRKIARELGIHRNTVDNYLGGRAGPAGSKCTISTAGSEGSEAGAADSKCTIPTTGSVGRQGGSGSGRASECEPWRDVIVGKLEAGLKATRIWRDLVDEHGFGHSYESVKRFVGKLKASEPQRVWRMECDPGQEAQVDYGTLRMSIAGKKRKVHVLRVVLSHSRKGYTEAMPRQDTESFIRGLENAFRHFGGVPQILVLDNLKAGVLKPDLYDPELNPKFASFCEHYRVSALPTRPRTPQHKGKVERGVAYVKDSALKGRVFGAFAGVNQHLRDWERRVADRLPGPFTSRFRDRS